MVPAIMACKPSLNFIQPSPTTTAQVFSGFAPFYSLSAAGIAIANVSQDRLGAVSDPSALHLFGGVQTGRLLSVRFGSEASLATGEPRSSFVTRVALLASPCGNVSDTLAHEVGYVLGMDASYEVGDHGDAARSCGGPNSLSGSLPADGSSAPSTSGRS
jgi:hypothetical protein